MVCAYAKKKKKDNTCGSHFLYCWFHPNSFFYLSKSLKKDLPNDANFSFFWLLDIWGSLRAPKVKTWSWNESLMHWDQLFYNLSLKLVASSLLSFCWVTRTPTCFYLCFFSPLYFLIQPKQSLPNEAVYLLITPVLHLKAAATHSASILKYCCLLSSPSRPADLLHISESSLFNLFYNVIPFFFCLVSAYLIHNKLTSGSGCLVNSSVQ